MRRQRFEVLSLAQQLERQGLRSQRASSRLRLWVDAFGRPQSLALCFGTGLLMGLYSQPRSTASSGRLLRWTNTVLLFARLGQRVRAAGAHLTTAGPAPAHGSDQPGFRGPSTPPGSGDVKQ